MSEARMTDKDMEQFEIQVVSSRNRAVILSPVLARKVLAEIKRLKEKALEAE